MWGTAARKTDAMRTGVRRPDAPTRSQGGSAYRSIKERGGRVPPRKAQEGVLGRWDLAR